MSRDVDTAAFPTDVVERSKDVTVVVDFWAGWCQPCKVLGPILEKVADEHAGDVELVKVDVDANPRLAASFGVQGIPSVIAFRDGQAVSRFTGALPERSVRDWMTAVLPSEADRFADRARAAALAGEVDTAEALFRQALEAEPGHVPAGTGLGELLIAGGDSEGALVVLAKLARTPEVERLEAAARVAGAHGGDLDSLRRRIDEDPGDHQARLDLGHALASQGDYAGALETLLEVVADRGELKDEARRAMLDIFEVLGANDPLAADYRRRLANALF